MQFVVNVPSDGSQGVLARLYSTADPTGELQPPKAWTLIQDRTWHLAVPHTSVLAVYSYALGPNTAAPSPSPTAGGTAAASVSYLWALFALLLLVPLVGIAVVCLIR
eukprot:EG_transcript_64376